MKRQIDNPEQKLTGAVFSEPLQNGLQQLSPDQSVPLILIDGEGMTYSEVALLTRQKIGTVRSRLHRGRKALRDQIYQADLQDIKSGSAVKTKPADQPLSSDFAVIRHAFQHLSPGQQALLYAVCFKQASYEILAAEHGVTPNIIATRFARTAGLFRQNIENLKANPDQLSAGRGASLSSLQIMILQNFLDPAYCPEQSVPLKSQPAGRPPRKRRQDRPLSAAPAP